MPGMLQWGMFGTIAQRLQDWRALRERRAQHDDTLRMFRKGDYPTHASIGLGEAFLAHLVDAQTVCGHPWIRSAMHEGPLFLEAWRKASLQLKSYRTKGYCMYTPKAALDSIMSAFEEPWAQGWGPQFDGDARSPSFRVVQWIHARDPHWMGSNLDVQLFTSSMSVWESLLFRDVQTSEWACTQWPERYRQQKFPWNDWAASESMWLYPLVFKCHARSPAEHAKLTAHLHGWSPLRGMEPMQRLQAAIAMMPLPANAQEKCVLERADRGLIWRALTHGMPPSIVDPIGAALACEWPDMHPDCTAIARHFYPLLQPTEWVQEALPADASLCTKVDLLRGSFATASLYSEPLAWVEAFAQQLNPAAGIENTTAVELPSNIFE